MRRIFERIAIHAHLRPQQVALTDHNVALTYRELEEAIPAVAEQLAATRVGLLMNNSCAWAVVDLAVQHHGAACVPIPPFFSDTQLAHLLADAEPDLIITDQPERLQRLLQFAPSAELEVAGRHLTLFRRTIRASHALPSDTAKITYTSGTTGQPKGVCLSGAAIAQVSIALSEAVGATPDDRALSLLPLSTLLENIGGVYAPLYSGGCAALPELGACGFSGSSAVQPQALVGAFHLFTPTSTILVPQLLKLLVECVAAGAPLPDTLRFMAVGGAPCSATLIERAREQCLPVYEGYGLSEAASVVALNCPTADQIGSVGRPLPHVQVRIAADGEIIVAGDLFGGYLGGGDMTLDEWPTGDLGYLDEAGYLHITGRKKTAYATAYGRNVAPEWVESELTGSPGLLQAAVFGEGQPFNVALVVPHPGATPAQIDAAVTAANSRLPDYARVQAWYAADEAFTARNGLARAAGSINREAIAQRYTTELESLYTGEEQDVAL